MTAGPPPYPGTPGQPYPPAGFPPPAAPYPPQGGYPPHFAVGQPVPAPPLRNVGLTRALGALTLIAWPAVIAFGFLTFTVITPKASGDDSTVSGWGRWTKLGEAIELRANSDVFVMPGVLPAVLILFPTLFCAIFILCNIGRRPMAIINAVFAFVAAIPSLWLVLDPSDVVFIFNSRSTVVLDTAYDYATGPAAILTLLACVAVLIGSIVGAIVGGKPRA